MIMYPLVGLCLGTLAHAASEDVTGLDQIPADAQTGTLNVELTTDDRADVNPAVGAVRLTVEEVHVRHVEMGWIRISEQPQSVDLMTIRDAEPVRLGGGEIYAGQYDALRLVVSDSMIVANGQEQALGFDQNPVQEQQMLQFEVPFALDTNTTRILHVDWELDAAIGEIGGQWSLATGQAVDLDLEG